MECIFLSQFTQTGISNEAFHIRELLQKFGHQIVQVDVDSSQTEFYQGELSTAAKTADCIFSFCELWQLNGPTVEILERLNIPWIHYTIIDSEPLPTYWKHYAPRIDYFVPITKFGQQLIQKEKRVHENIYHSLNPIFNEKPFFKFNITNLDDNCLKLGYAGVNVFRKNLLSLLLIVKELKKHIDVKLFLRTSVISEEGATLSAYVRVFGLEQDIVFVNTLDQQQLVGFYDFIDILINPEFSCGFGFTQLEALQCGTPVLTTDTPVTREILLDTEEYLINSKTFETPVKSKWYAPDIEDCTKKILAEPKWKNMELERFDVDNKWKELFDDNLVDFVELKNRE